jgi:hypothetical protein
MARAYDKMGWVRTFQQGELVLVLKRPIIGRHIGPKFSSENKETGAKLELKITGVIIMNLGIFGENFMIFGQVELSE